MTRPETYHCDRCNYNFTGLPEVGKCPECGSPYSLRAMVGVKMPERSSSRSDRITRRLWTIIWSIMAVMALSCGGLVSLVVPRPERAWGLGIVFALVMALAAVTSYVHEKG